MWLLRLRYSCMAKEALTKSFKSYIAQKIQFVNVSQTNNFNTNQNVLITFKGRVCNWLLLRNQCVVCCINVNLPPPPPSKLENASANFGTCMYQLRETLCEFPLIHPLSKVIHSEKLTQVFLIPLLSKKVRGDGTLSFPGGMLV